MPDELHLTSAQYEDVTINEYNQAALNSGDPDRHITYEIVHGKYHFFPNTSKRRIDLVNLMHAHCNQTYCQETSFCIGENHISWKINVYLSQIVTPFMQLRIFSILLRNGAGPKLILECF